MNPDQDARLLRKLDKLWTECYKIPKIVILRTEFYGTELNGIELLFNHHVNQL